MKKLSITTAGLIIAAIGVVMYAFKAYDAISWLILTFTLGMLGFGLTTIIIDLIKKSRRKNNN